MTGRDCALRAPSFASASHSGNATTTLPFPQYELPIEDRWLVFDPL
jgi:hypothetical protein